MTRYRKGRTLETCENLAAYFIGRLALNKGHHDLDDLALTESFNHALNGYPGKDGERDVSNDWSPEEVTTLLAELMARGKADLQALRMKRSHIPSNEWRAVDSAIAIGLGGEGIEGIEGREERRRRMHVHAEYIKQVERARNMTRKAAAITPRNPKGPVVLRLGPGRRPKPRKKVEWVMNIPVRLNGVEEPRAEGEGGGLAMRKAQCCH